MQFEKFEHRYPTHQNAVEIFRGKWASDLSYISAITDTGTVDLFDGDERPRLAAQELGRHNRFDGMSILELGPLEGGHTYQLERLGAENIIAIEANAEAFLKCLVVKEIFSLRARFMLGDVIEYLLNPTRSFDLVFCSGVLYHMHDPVTLIKLIASVSDRCFVWTHYYDEQRKVAERTPRKVRSHGFDAIYYDLEYPSMEIDRFWGGNKPIAAWMERGAILDCFRYFGFTSLKILAEDPENPLGPNFSFAARRVSSTDAMQTRAQILLAPVPLGGRIIEIGPSYNPIAPKSGGWNSASIDHLTREGLVTKFTGHPGVDVSRIEPVDFIWTDGPLSAAVPPVQHGSFDAFVASHVIEHSPDLIAFLDSAATLLKPEGLVILAIPDKRYCFDYFQPLSTTGQVLEAHAEKRARHLHRVAFDHFAYGVADGEAIAWSQRPSKGLSFMKELETANDLSAAFEHSLDYIDVHAWRFVPPSFELLLLELARLGKTDWRVERITPAEGCEFFAWLRRGGINWAAALSAEELARRRMSLLKRALLETQAQIDWLLEGEPEIGDVVVSGPPLAVAQEGAATQQLRHRATKLEAELVAALAERDALLNSATWRVTLPMRRIGEVVPLSARSIIRRILRLRD